MTGSHPEVITAEWTNYFHRHPGQTFATIRTPSCRDHQEAYAIAKRIVYDLANGTNTEISRVSAIGVYCASDNPAERHVHLIICTESAAFNQLDNRKDASGTRPALPLRRRHPVLADADGLEISPIENKNAIDRYMATNYIKHTNTATAILTINQSLLHNRQAA